MDKAGRRENQIFICYRRDDSAWVAGRLYDRLTQKFGREAVFKDIDSIPFGVNFKQHIDSVVTQCDVVLALIGDKWSGEVKEVGKRRIDDPRDFVRVEIESALQRNIPVIPLLVQNASIPPEDDLPPTLKELAYRHGMQIGNDPHFHTDVDRLIRSIEAYFAGKSSTGVQKPTPDANVAANPNSPPAVTNALAERTSLERLDIQGQSESGRDYSVDEPRDLAGSETKTEDGPANAAPVPAENVKERRVAAVDADNPALPTGARSATSTNALPGSSPEPYSSESSLSITESRPPRRARRPSWIVGSAAALSMGVILVALLWNYRPELSAAEAQAKGIAATVNDRQIMLSEVDAIADQMGDWRDEMSPLEKRQARLQVLDGLIQQEVLFQRAESEGLLPTEDEVTQAINDQKRRSKLTEEEVQKALKDLNLTESHLRAIAHKQLAVRKLQDNWNSKISISDKEIEDHYNLNREKFTSARGVGLSAIVSDPADNGMADDAKSDAEAQEKIESIYRQLQSGDDFTTVARGRSEDSNNVRGGELGFATEGDLLKNKFPRDLIGKFFHSMRPGDMTAPVRFDNGRWYIFKLTDRRLREERLTLDAPGVRDKIKEELIDRRKQVANEELLKATTNKAKIVNFLASYT